MSYNSCKWFNKYFYQLISRNFTVEAVKTPLQASQFAEIFCEIFNMPNILEHVKRWAIKQYEMEDPTCINYLGKIGIETAGISSLVIDKQFKEFKTGGFYNAGVLSKFRRSGLATVMAFHRINIARKIE